MNRLRCTGRISYALALLAVCAVSRAGRGDVLLYTVPNTPFQIVLQGSAKVNPGRTVSYRHPSFGTLYMALDDVKIIKVPTVREQFGRRLAAAKRTGDAEQIVQVADWCLRYGLVDQVYECAEAARSVDPNCQRALDILQLRQMMRQPISDSSDQEKFLRELVPKGGMRFARSPHYLLYHDTPGDGKDSRSQQRLALLERVYEGFLLKFFSQGVKLAIPKERMMVVLFNNRGDYLAFANRLGPDMASTAGFWHTPTNVAVFFDQGTSDRFEAIMQLEKIFADLKKQALDARGPQTRDIVRMADSLTLIMQIVREEADVEVVSHEATHQLAGNTGLLPRQVMIPSWVHEGLASYFETPEDASWGGIGAVNSERLNYYRQLSRDTEHSNISFIVGDQIFKYARTNNATLHGYGQAWALTHFLIEKHFDKYMAFCRRLGELPADVTLSPDFLTRVFDEVFQEDRDALNTQWRFYMRELKTDLDKILEDE